MLWSAAVKTSTTGQKLGYATGHVRWHSPAQQAAEWTGQRTGHCTGQRVSLVWCNTESIQRGIFLTGHVRWMPRCVEESARREHLVLARTKGELHPCVGARMRTSGEWRLSDTSGKHQRVPLLSLLWAFTLSISILIFTSLERRVLNFCAIESIETHLGTRGEMG